MQSPDQRFEDIRKTTKFPEGWQNYFSSESTVTLPEQLTTSNTKCSVSRTDCSWKICFKFLMCTYSYWQMSHVFTLRKESDIILLIFSTNV